MNAMHRSAHVRVWVDLAALRSAGEAIAATAGVPLFAVVKADAYGLGAVEVIETLAGVAERFCFFDLREAVEADAAGRADAESMTFALPDGNAADHIRRRVRPAVWTLEQARRFRGCGPVLCLDTGMQRFSAPLEEAHAILKAGGCDEVMTHATRPDHAAILRERFGGLGLRLHAASSRLLHVPEARLDAVRPGLALYRNAVRVSTPLVEARPTRGPGGYGGFLAEHHGVILCGYANGLRAGPCRVNGQARRILEVGMQSAFVEIGPESRVGDEVTLLGDGLGVEDVADQWSVSAQEALVRLCGMGQRIYIPA